MVRHKVLVETNGEGRAMYLYDTTIPLPERLNARLEFRSGLEAARFLGVPPYRIYKNVATRQRIYCRAQDKWYAVRLKLSSNANPGLPL